jgi:hypothetical protein
MATVFEYKQINLEGSADTGGSRPGWPIPRRYGKAYRASCGIANAFHVTKPLLSIQIAAKLLRHAIATFLTLGGFFSSLGRSINNKPSL